MNLQIAVAKETLKLEVKEIDKTSSGVFIDRLNKDTEDISGMFMEYSFCAILKTMADFFPSFFNKILSNPSHSVEILVSLQKFARKN